MTQVTMSAMTARELGRLVREVRRAAGLTQCQLAAAAGVGPRFLIELEAGKPTAQLGKTLHVLKLLGCQLRIETPPGLPVETVPHEVQFWIG